MVSFNISVIPFNGKTVTVSYNTDYTPVISCAMKQILLQCILRNDSPLEQEAILSMRWMLPSDAMSHWTLKWHLVRGGRDRGGRGFFQTNISGYDDILAKIGGIVLFVLCGCFMLLWPKYYANENKDQKYCALEDMTSSETDEPLLVKISTLNFQKCRCEKFENLARHH